MTQMQMVFQSMKGYVEKRAESMVEHHFTIDLQAPYRWEVQYLPLYRSLRDKKYDGETLDKDESKLLEWLSFSFVRFVREQNND